jgi:hypothetical protein
MNKIRMLPFASLLMEAMMRTFAENGGRQNDI